MFPVTVSIAICWLNIHGWYIGAHLSGPFSDKAKLNLIQVAAKIHELMMQASIISMVLSYVRHEARRGHGLPFGAFLAGQECIKVSYLWSLPFWGAILSPIVGSRRRKAAIIIILVAATVLAATVGPSSAIAMMPVISEWRTSGREGFVVESTADDLWPYNVNGTATPGVNCQDSLTSNDGCENPLVAYFTARRMGSLGSGNAVEQGLTDLIDGGMARRIVDRSNTPSLSADNVFSISPFAISEWLLRTSSMWIGEESQILTYRSANFFLDTFQPSVLVSCYCRRVYSNHWCPDDTELLDSDHINIPHLGATNGSVVSIPYSTNSLPLNETEKPSLTWFQIPDGTLGEPSIGAFVSLPRLNDTHPDSPSTDPPKHWGCAVDARWAPVSLQRVGDAVLGNPQYLPLPPLNDTDELDLFRAESPQNLSWRHAKIGQDWAKSLDRPFTGSSDSLTTFQTLVESLGLNHISRKQIEVILASMIALGLSNVKYDSHMTGPIIWDDGSHHTIMTGDYTLQMRVVITGYNYQISNDIRTMSLAIAILLTYSAMATFYMVFMIGLYRKSSNSWGSLAEITTLAVNSSRTELLHGTCAGIESIKTFSLNVRVVDTSGKEITDEEIQEGQEENQEDVGHLVLQFSAEMGKWDEDFRRIKNDKAYS
jgi:hypothetical protein